ncbi:uncharacterized protein B0H64DRAFT_211004 [Chaetomium fimeti]|uniref:Uncharacterized protein n=1 Tax=Chaetomium fimeti TaxID=1854472 RepID=A0AAE0LQN9_9PEZI|nr:hypothetical protein B0H64DRAFT_211004 [Chaetomium fimeti]
MYLEKVSDVVNAFPVDLIPCVYAWCPVRSRGHRSRLRSGGQLHLVPFHHLNDEAPRVTYLVRSSVISLKSNVESENPEQAPVAVALETTNCMLPPTHTNHEERTTSRDLVVGRQICSQSVPQGRMIRSRRVAWLGKDALSRRRNAAGCCAACRSAGAKGDGEQEHGTRIAESMERFWNYDLPLLYPVERLCGGRGAQGNRCGVQCQRGIASKRESWEKGFLPRRRMGGLGAWVGWLMIGCDSAS